MWTLLAQPADSQANPLAQAIHAAVAAGALQLAVAGLRRGNFPSGDASEPARGAVYQALAQARASRAMQLVGGTQTPAWRGKQPDLRRGCLAGAAGRAQSWRHDPSGCTGQTDVLLALAELHGWSAAQVAMLFQRALLGEMRDATLLDSRRGGVLRPARLC